MISPAIKSFVYFAPVAEGVYFRAADRIFILKFKGPYKIVSQLVGLLDGARPLTDIRAGLPDPVRPLFDTLVQELDRHAMLVDCGRQTVSDLSEAERTVHGSLLAFLRDHLDDFEAGFARWRRLPVAVVGHGRIAEAVTRALLRLGAGDLQLWTLGQPLLPGLDQRLRERVEADARFSFCVMTAQDPASAMAIRRAILCGPDLDDREVRIWSASVPILIAAEVHGRCVIGPAQGETRGGDLLDRLRPAPIDAPTVSRAQQELLGASAAFELFMLETGADPSRLRNKALVVENDLQITDHVLLPTSAVAAQDWRPPAPRFQGDATPEGRSLSDFEHQSIALRPLFDPVFGPFSKRGADEAPQLPLCHDRLEIRYPSNSELAPESITAWGFGLEDASRRLLLRAVAIYAERSQEFYGGAAAGRLCAEMDEAAWRRQAIAVSLVESQIFCERAATAEVDPTGAPSRELSILARILAVYRPKGVKVQLVAASGLPAAYAICSDAEGVIGYGLAPTPVEALVECLGSACSRLQLGDGPVLRPPTPPARAATPAAALAWLEPTGEAPPLPLALRTHHIDQGSALASLGLHIGHVELLPQVEEADVG